MTDSHISVLPIQDDKETASLRLQLAAVGVAALAVAFTIGVACTDRPYNPKPSTE